MYLIQIGGQVVRVSITSQLTTPVVVHFRAEPFDDPDAYAPVVATWCQGEWNLFEGAEGADPRPIVEFAVDKGYVLRGPCPRDWPVVKGFLTQLARAPSLWQR